MEENAVRASNRRQNTEAGKMALSLSDLLLALGAAGVAVCVRKYTDSWLASGLAFALLLVFIRTRRRPFSSMPGAVVATLCAWILLPLSPTKSGEIVITEMAALLGASLNSLPFGYRITALVGITAVLLSLAVDYLVR